MVSSYWKNNKEEFDNLFDKTYDNEIKSINDQLDKDILFVLVGNVNSGKSSTINLLMDDKVAKVSSKPGETIIIEEHQYADKILFVDTPGLDDIVKDNSDVTLNYYKNADVILFFLNAAGNVLSLTEKKVFEKINSNGKNERNNTKFIESSKHKV